MKARERALIAGVGFLLGVAGCAGSGERIGRAMRNIGRMS